MSEHSIIDAIKEDKALLYDKLVSVLQRGMDIDDVCDVLFYVWQCPKCESMPIRRVNTKTKTFRTSEVQCRCPECGKRTRFTLKGLPRFTNKQDAYDYRRHVK